LVEILRPLVQLYHLLGTMFSFRLKWQWWMEQIFFLRYSWNSGQFVTSVSQVLCWLFFVISLAPKLYIKMVIPPYVSKILRDTEKTLHRLINK
jgi:hypothetical protein